MSNLLKKPENRPPTIRSIGREKKARTLRSIRMVWDQNVNLYRNVSEAAWGGSAEECQAFFDAYGTDAVDLFIMSAALRDFINDLEPGTISDEEATPPYNYTINPDGTVVVGDPVDPA